MDPGKREHLITVQTAGTTTDDYGQAIPDWGNPVEVESPWAEVRFGRADEKRQAAQEGGVQAATFLVDPSAALLAVPLTARIVFDGSDWNITEVAPLDRQTLRFTAVRSK